ncbi:two-component regulator propeller domain-containing protein [Clostridium sp. D53t1_180928_C8]|uniref:ligand-binding sensor domain-containing protein n=1 Tax=Clostridium sp. D53t1_180928_C8 TaxID=2787101 RepID=UPI0018A9281E|nr:two-component regulator propeller domain-containing protein [Clostridium sp. D53t1_180928_C8]
MYKNLKKSVLILVFLFIIIIFDNKSIYASKIDYLNTSVAENQKVNFENITIRDGISSDFITCIYQDSRGFIWIGTNDGLNQYNGESVKIYNCEEGLSGTHINAINEDSNGAIWVGTSNGLNIINSKTEEVEQIPSDINNEFAISHYNVTSIYRDVNDTMWVGTKKGLNEYNSENKNFKKYFGKDLDENSYLSDSYITDIEGFYKKEDKNFILIGTRQGINSLDIKNRNVKENEYEYEENIYVYDIEVDKNSRIWVATNKGVRKYNNEDDTLVGVDIDFGEDMYTDITKVLCDKKNNLWFASTNGVVKYNEYENKTWLYKSDKRFINYLASNIIQCFFEDRSGILWVGTDNGISKLNITQQISNDINIILKNENIEKTSVTSIIKDNYGELWIGTKYQGLIRILLKENKVKRYVYDENDLNTIDSNCINYVFQDDKGEMIIITDNGISLLDKEDEKIHRVSIEKSVNKDYIQFQKIIKDSDGNKWLASNMGIYKWDKETSEVKSYADKFEEYGIQDKNIVDIYQDKFDNNILWLAGDSYTGLIKFHKEYGVLKNYISKKDEDSLSYDSINCIQEDECGNLWIGTDRGLNKFNIENESFTVYLKEDGIKSEYINSIIIDSNGDLWIGTNNGLCKYDISQNRFISYNENYGVIGNQFNLNSCYKTNTGEVLFGTNEGIVSFNPDKIEELTYEENKVEIGSIIINGKAIDFNGCNINLELNSNENNIEIKFFLPDYRNYFNVTYMHMIEGIDDEWISSTNESYAKYSAVQPGNYIFKVRAIQEDGSITEDTSIKIEVKSPWWMTKTAYFIYIVLGMMIVVYCWNHINILRALVDKQTKEINEKMIENKLLYEKNIKSEKFKNDYFVNLSHELRTPINIILSTVQLINSLGKDKDIPRKKLNHYMEIVQKSSNSLLRIINDIIDSSKIESGTYKIKKQNSIDIVYLVEETALTMSDYIEEKGISLIIDPEIEEKEISCDPNEIERCIVNIIGNAIKFTPEGGKIEVFIKDNNTSVSISIKDDGIGISEEDQRFIFNRFEQGKNESCTKVSSSGIGLTLVKYIVTLHDGTIDLESELEKGSKFTITLPCE